MAARVWSRKIAMDRILTESESLATSSIEFIDAMKWVFMPHINIAATAEADGAVFESKELLQYIFDSIQDGISVLDNDLNIRYVNASMNHWYSDSGTLMNQKCYKAYHHRKTPCENCPILKAIEHKAPFVGIVKYSPSGDQQKGWQELFAIPILDSKNEVLGVMEYVRDITVVFKINDQLNCLLRRFEKLEKENEAFSYLLSQRKSEIEELEATIATNMERFVRPSLDILKKELAPNDLDLVESLINEIVYPITKKRSAKIERLTSRELQIATLIKEGKTSRAIANALCITLKTVEYHRANIRRKLGLNKDGDQQMNLRNYLLSNL
jgi:DNA-binding CsgD family transcriptional regulator